MPSNQERNRGVGYPGLTQEAIDLLLDCLLFGISQRDLGNKLDLAEETAAKLSNFYTARWGLPPCITGRVARIREIAAERGLT